MDHIGEWVSATVVDATLVVDGQAERVRIQVGLFRLYQRGGVRIASQVVGRDNELFLLPPASAARIIGALRGGLRP